ncbi:hypothetical protein ARMSODRAFT_1019672 [Armillaria solidipes]|uniref:Uncharacterized protein n=1 Tax=Armillaria solidipes TaxID=1076256 RepID=A0A2H3BXC7_9AGAR|nr:hypothetical protein ARMSODRAFT_1019672 [Armillaria solidipes]
MMITVDIRDMIVSYRIDTGPGNSELPRAYKCRHDFSHFSIIYDHRLVSFEATLTLTLFWEDMGSSPSKAKFTDAGPTMAPGANPPVLNQRRGLNVTRPCDMDSLLQAIKPNTYIDAYYSQKPGIVMAGGVFIAVLLLMIVVMIYTFIKKQKADRRRIVVLSQSGKEQERYHDEVISSSVDNTFASDLRRITETQPPQQYVMDLKLWCLASRP